MNQSIKTIVAIFVALQFLVFGANKFLGFVNPPPPSDPVALTFLGGMFGSYLGKMVGFFEIVGAILLLFPRTRFLGVLVLLPIVFNIIMFHLAHDNPGNGIWLVTSLTFGLVCWFEKVNFIELLKIQSK